MVQNRIYKGKNLLEFPKDYVVLDIETSGNPYADPIIEVGALKVRNGKIADTYDQLIDPQGDINYFVTELTGITNEMVRGKPIFSDVAEGCYRFLENEIIVGHNVHFDINFMYDAFLLNGFYLSNDFVDLLRISRRLSPTLENHKLGTVATSLGVSYKGAHRGLTDCIITYECFERYRKMVEEGASLGTLSNRKYHVSPVVGDPSKNRLDHPFYHKWFCFTGILTKFSRKEAMQRILDIGGYCEDSVTSNTDYLIVGDKSRMSSKLRKAERYISEGKNIEIMEESIFCKVLQEVDKG